MITLLQIPPAIAAIAGIGSAFYWLRSARVVVPMPKIGGWDDDGSGYNPTYAALQLQARLNAKAALCACVASVFAVLALAPSF